MPAGDTTAQRCFGDGVPLYEEYHDEEWGRPVRDERGLFERLSLEAFQVGLSWLTILRKRPRFREVFAGFDPDAVARYGAADVERLLDDPGIVRHRGKIEATIANAAATIALRETGLPLEALVWSFAPEPRARRLSGLGDMPTETDESRALSAALRKRGFRFIGPVNVYAAMQACGLVDDHVAGCPVAIAWDRDA